MSSVEPLPEVGAIAAIPGPGTAVDATAARPRAAGIWNRDFLLLWQGQLVSALGDTIYEIALGFWVLQKTGSTALMGTLMAVSTLPRVVISPFAGVIVDRSERKRLLVAMDILRGVFITLVALAAYAGYAQVWMVFVAGVVISIGGAFFGPAVGSAMPDIVPKDRLVQANSAFNLIYTGSGVVGSAGGGFLFQALGAPLMFLLNGLSYLVSALTLFFMRIPKVAARGVRLEFLADLRAGLAFTWRFSGLRWMAIIASVLNFFASMGIVLFLPLFQRAPELGAARYGLAMGVFSAGLFLGFLSGTLVKYPPRSRYTVFMFCGLVMSVCMIAFPLVGSYPAMLVLGCIAGVVNAVLNSFIGATVGLAVPQDMRGKVFALIGTLSGGLTPIAMALAGVLAEFIPMRPLIAACFVLTLLMFVPLLFIPSFRHFVNFDPGQESVDSLMA